MFLNQKKGVIIPILIMILIFTAVPLSAHAQEEIVEPEDVGVSTVCPEIQLYSTSRPSKVWNIATKGRYNFKGVIKSSDATFYTDYKFKGKGSYTFHVKNTGKSTLVVKAKRLTKTYIKASIAAGASKTVAFSDIKKTTEFYLTFEGSSFSGYIK